MGKGHSGNAHAKEHSEMQKLKHENQKLKRQLNRLRKQLARVDLEEFTNVKDALIAQEREDAVIENETQDKMEIEHWRCYQCEKDYLRLIIVQRPDGDFYFRKCPNCQRRTRLQPFNNQVQGPRAS